MNISDIGAVEFVTQAAAGIINVEFGFQPDIALVVINHGGANPDILVWANNDDFTNWAAALHLLISGAGGTTRVAACITAYAGGDAITSAETDETAGKHVNIRGTVAAAGHITSPGITIPAASLVNSGRNLAVGVRINR